MSHDVFVNGKVSLWDAGLRHVRDLDGHEGAVLRVKFAGNGAHLVSADEAGVVLVWDVCEGSLTARFSDHRVDQHRDIWGLCATPTDNYFAAAGANGLVVVRRLPAGEEVARFYSHTPLTSVALDAESSLLAAGGPGGKILLWQVGAPHSGHVLVEGPRYESGISLHGPAGAAHGDDYYGLPLPPPSPPAPTPDSTLLDGREQAAPFAEAEESLGWSR